MACIWAAAGAGWKGKLVTDDFSGYKACFELGVIEVGCMAHARRKFHELWANHGSQVAEQALKFFGELYDVEREVAEADSQARLEARRRRSRPVADALHQWLIEHRKKVPNGSATARAIDYSLNRWAALTRYIDDPALPIDNNWVENQIRPIAIGRNNWLFAGSLLDKGPLSLRQREIVIDRTTARLGAELPGAL